MRRYAPAPPCSTSCRTSTGKPLLSGRPVKLDPLLEKTGEPSAIGLRSSKPLIGFSGLDSNGSSTPQLTNDAAEGIDLLRTAQILKWKGLNRRLCSWNRHCPIRNHLRIENQLRYTSTLRQLRSLQRITRLREILSPYAPITSRFPQPPPGAPVADAGIGSLAIPHRNQTTGRGRVLEPTPRSRIPRWVLPLRRSGPFRRLKVIKLAGSSRNHENEEVTVDQSSLIQSPKSADLSLGWPENHHPSEVC
jgi:hypothetical protein